MCSNKLFFIGNIPMKMKLLAVASIITATLTGCATGDTPAAKKNNALLETDEALLQIYEDHPGAVKKVTSSLAYLVCTGSDSYLLAASSGGGVCVLKEKGTKNFYRFASLGVGAGIGFKKVAFVYAYQDADALRRFQEEGWDAGARAEASAKHEEEGGQAATNASFDVDGVSIYQSSLWGAAAQATVQGYKFWPTDFSDDVIEN
jgi:lipid-binding SYLF domain-containing protein